MPKYRCNRVYGEDSVLDGKFAANRERRTDDKTEAHWQESAHIIVELEEDSLSEKYHELSKKKADIVR